MDKGVYLVFEEDRLSRLIRHIFLHRSKVIIMFLVPDTMRSVMFSIAKSALLLAPTAPIITSLDLNGVVEFSRWPRDQLFTIHGLNFGTHQSAGLVKVTVGECFR
jgi:hypothetical protein